MKKILVTYVSYGSGHKTIAEYIANYLQKFNYDIRLVDLVDTMNARTLKTVDVFDYVYNHRLEKFFSFLYKISDNGFIRKNYKIYTKKFLYNNKVKKLYTEFNPDIVISTHWYGSNIAAYMKEKKIINPEIITVVTDYKVHKIWLTSYDKNEHFIVANDIVKNSLIKNNCYSNNIHSFGLPVDLKKVRDILPKEEIINKYKLDKKKKKIFFFGGGSNSKNGNYFYLNYLKKILKLESDYEILFICGKNEDLYKVAKNLEKRHSNLKILGFVTNVYELMSISDIVVSKSGGAVVTECLEMKKFLVVLPGMGGQENYNAKFIVKNNYGVRIRNKISFKRFMKKFYLNPSKYLDKYNSKKINNESLKQIAALVKKL